MQLSKSERAVTQTREVAVEVGQFWIHFVGRTNRIGWKTKFSVGKKVKQAPVFEPEQLQEWSCHLLGGKFRLCVLYWKLSGRSGSRHLSLHGPAAAHTIQFSARGLWQFLPHCQAFCSWSNHRPLKELWLSAGGWVSAFATCLSLSLLLSSFSNPLYSLVYKTEH